MADHPGQGITFGGVPLDKRLSEATPRLIELVTATLADQLPVYARMPAEELHGEIRRIITRGIREVSAMLRTGALPDPERLAWVRESAARRAEEGVPVEAVVEAYHVGVGVCLDFIEPHADPADVAQVFAAHRLLLGYLRRITAAVSAGYVSERQTLLREEHTARQSLLAALLDGRLPAEEDVRLPACYLVLNMAVADHPDERRHGVDAVVAARRKLRRLQAELDRRAREPVLSTLSGGGGLALVPYPVAEPDLAARDWAWLSALVGALTSAAGTGITAAVVPTEPTGVPRAARLAAELCEVATIFRRPPGLYRLPDLVLEYQLTRPGPARDALAELLEPAADRPELLDTVRIFLDSGLHRRLAATRLQVHPNTVDYRLRKLAALTGLDVARHDDLLTIRAALAARDARGFVTVSKPTP